MHEIDSNDEPYKPLTEFDRQRILAQRILPPEEIDPLSREEARIAGEFALKIANYMVRNAGAEKRRAISNRLREFDISHARDLQPKIIVHDKASRNGDNSLTTTYTFLPDRVKKELDFTDSRFNYATEADFGDLLTVAREIYSSDLAPKNKI